jgi:hypothetical protein
VLVVDPGITATELACLGDDLRASGQLVVAGFATHPDWDNVLWDAAGRSPASCPRLELTPIPWAP